jgi:hypothetical protein
MKFGMTATFEAHSLLLFARRLKAARAVRRSARLSLPAFRARGGSGYYALKRKFPLLPQSLKKGRPDGGRP